MLSGDRLLRERHPPSHQGFAGEDARLGVRGSRMRAIRTVVPAVVAAVLLGVPATGASVSTATSPPADATRAVEARRVDRVPTPRPDWFNCNSIFGSDAECATVDLPLDYDKPRGAKTSVAVLRIKATNQKRKIGTLFLNPGGPGASGVEIAAAAPFFLAPKMLARFDIVGVDPRGVAYSDNVRCWKNAGAQSAVLTALAVPFPWTRREENAYVTSSRAFGKACSTTGRPLTASMSTYQVARDMDVLRRAMGDSKLTFLGFSYGSYLGNVYANMFPDRVRAIALDGVLDPTAWAGTRANLTTPQTTLLKSGEGAARALHEILVRCRKAGPDYCNFAAAGNPVTNYARIISSLKRAPLVISDPDTGEEFVIDYPTLVGWLLDDMYYPFGAAFVDSDLSAVFELLQRPARTGSKAAAARAAARTALAERAREARAADKATDSARARHRAALGFGFPYDNSFETFQTVLCTDGINPPEAGKWPGYADAADLKAPDFGRLWTWYSAPCASKTWTVRDEDAFRGPFTRRTANTVLVVGNYWDPATNYAGAAKVASLLPNSRLLSSDSWGHTAYGTSACVTEAVDSYLLSRARPPVGTVCVGDDQPFTEPLEEGPEERYQAPEERRGLPPVVPPLPGATPRS
jgi:pimeloyl-ACP methyl ester carboxylesterase